MDLLILRSGEVLTIEAQGNFTKKVEEGAYVELSIKYGLIRIINTSVDLCQQLKEIDEECPVEGPKTITKSVQLPKEIPRVWVHPNPCLSHVC